MMQNRLSVRCLMLGMGLGVSFLSGRSALGSADVPLDPNAFASLGALSGATTYVFNTGNGSSTPTVTLNGSTVLSGVISNGVAVFDFSSVTISTGATATGSGALPLAILSRGAVSISGVVNMSASGPTAGPGGFSAPSIGGFGPGGGRQSGGGGFGGAGGAGYFGAGGGTYGDLTHVFLGGSSGGGSGTPGGGGGGALEISALGNISFQTGTISSNGGNDTSLATDGSGGGSGGGILLATPGQILAGSMNVTGGVGGGTLSLTGGVGGGILSLTGGDGGGGRILLESSLFSTTDPALINVAGGSGPNALQFPTNPGSPGTFTTIGYVTPVPEPGTLALALSAGVALLARRRR